MPKKLPYLPLYTGDLLKEDAFNILPDDQKWIWIRLLISMHNNPERGKLGYNGKPFQVESIARIIGRTESKTESILNHFVDCGLASREDDTEIVYCRRMVRDESIRQQRSIAGKKGAKATWSQEPKPEFCHSKGDGNSQGGPEKLPCICNTFPVDVESGEIISTRPFSFGIADYDGKSDIEPLLPWQNLKQSGWQTDGKRHGSYIVFQISNSSKKKYQKEIWIYPLSEKLGSQDMVEALNDYFDSRKKHGHKTLLPKSIANILNRLNGFSHEQSLAAVRDSADFGWQGIFPGKAMPKASNAQSRETGYNNQGKSYDELIK